jgi:hypothetical protein
MKLKPAYQTFEETFLLLLKKAENKPISVHTFLTTLSGRGKVLLLMFLSLGFAQIPAIAIFLGVFIAYLGIRIGMGKQFIWVPRFLSRKKIPTSFFNKLLRPILQMLKFMKRWSRPRYEWATQKSSTRLLNGLMIALVGLCLATSPPVPLTGASACIPILLIAIGLLNDDGVYIILGYVAALFYFLLVLLLLNYFSVTQIFEWVKNLFS